MGISSFGISCGIGIPNIYTRVAGYIDWIEDIVWLSGNGSTIEIPSPEVSSVEIETLNRPLVQSIIFFDLITFNLFKFFNIIVDSP